MFCFGTGLKLYTYSKTASAMNEVFKTYREYFFNLNVKDPAQKQTSITTTTRKITSSLILPHLTILWVREQQECLITPKTTTGGVFETAKLFRATAKSLGAVRQMRCMRFHSRERKSSEDDSESLPKFTRKSISVKLIQMMINAPPRPPPSQFPWWAASLAVGE